MRVDVGFGVEQAGHLELLLIWRSDWAANQVFLFGALLIMVLSAIALKTHARLMRG